MRVGLQTWGTEGDVRPFFALTAALAARGHEVRLLYTSVEGRTYEPLARSLGIDARPVACDYFVSHHDEVAPRLAAVLASSSPLRQIRGILEASMDPVEDALFTAGDALAAWSDAVVGHFILPATGAAATGRGRPFAMVSFAPVLPSSRFAPAGTPDLGPLGHPIMWKIAGMVLESIMRDRINRARARAGLSPIKDLLKVALDHMVLSLAAVSPTLFPRPDDWDPRIQLSGFLAIPESAEPWVPEDRVRASLEAGPPPAFLSFGSMLNLPGGRTHEAVAALRGAVKLAGTRGILQASAEVAAAFPPDEDLCFLTRAPHGQLFPRCSVIVHHGGAGTTQSAMLAGRPSVVVPHVADQFFWADRLEARGIAGKPLARTRLTAARLGDRLRRVLADGGMRERAEQAAVAIRTEDGAARGAELLEAAFVAALDAPGPRRAP